MVRDQILRGKNKNTKVYKKIVLRWKQKKKMAQNTSSTTNMETTPIVCYAPTMITTNGVWQGDNPLDYSLPLFILQLTLVVVVTRVLVFLLKPLRQPRVIAEILVSTLSQCFYYTLGLFSILFESSQDGVNIIGHWVVQNRYITSLLDLDNYCNIYIERGGDNIYTIKIENMTLMFLPNLLLMHHDRFKLLKP